MKFLLNIKYIPALSISSILVLFLLTACSNGNEEEISLPSTETELRQFLVQVQKSADSHIQTINAQYAKSSQPHKNQSYDSLPIQVSITSDGIGLVWERVLIEDLSPEQVEAMKILFDVPISWLEQYCIPPVINWMREFGYHVREKLYAGRGGELISNYLINISTCEDHLAIIEMMRKKQHEEDSNEL